MITYISHGDIFSIEGVTNYAHGCNCAGAMGKGIALVFREKYPQMYNTYRTLCRNGKFQPGSIYEYYTGKGYVFNLGTQISWKTGATLPYIRTALQNMVSFALDNGVHKISMPTIGAGLGGLKWNDVKCIIEEIAGNIPSERLMLYVVENYSPTNS